MRHTPKGWAKRSKGPRVDPPDPYSPASPGYAERHQQVVTEYPDGTVRVDLGAPIPRNAAEPQPVIDCGPEREAPAAPAVAPQDAPQVSRRPTEPDLKPGLGKPSRGGVA